MSKAEDGAELLGRLAATRTQMAVIRSLFRAVGCGKAEERKVMLVIETVNELEREGLEQVGRNRMEGLMKQGG
jgi:hypothetical protein